MDGSGGEGAAGAGGLAAWIPPAPPGPGACEVPHVAHRASHIVACVCGRACVVCVCVCVRACVCPCVLLCAGRAEQPEPGDAFCGAAGTRAAGYPPTPHPFRALHRRGGSAAPFTTAPGPPGGARPSAPVRGGSLTARLGGGRCCTGAGKKWRGTGGEGEAERYLRRPRSRLETSEEGGGREEKTPATPAGHTEPAGGPRSSPKRDRLARASS